MLLCKMDRKSAYVILFVKGCSSDNESIFPGVYHLNSIANCQLSGPFFKLAAVMKEVIPTNLCSLSEYPHYSIDLEEEK